MYGFSEKSPTAKAFEMFAKGKSPVDVVKALDIPPLDANKLHSEYLRLEDRHTVNLFFNETKEKLPEFTSICHVVKKYCTDDTMKIRFLRIIDLDRIIETMKRKKEQTDLDSRKSLEYNNRIFQETQSMEKQIEIARKRITNQW